MGDRRVAVAYSGGRDSTALLHATAQAAQGLGVEVCALHVHHGLSEQADQWLAHCERQCRLWAEQGLPVRFIARRLLGRPSPGDSVEAWARQARYRALADLAHGAQVCLVLLAHHRRDQAETWLLQALRGGGVAGLAGMPRSITRDGLTWQRPWLDRPGEDIDDYVLRHGLSHIEDDTNDDMRYARNRLRRQVWPPMLASFEHAEASLARAADWAQQAQAALHELAQIDLHVVADGSGLNVSAWQGLSLARRSNALRAWVRQQTGDSAPAALVTRLMDELGALRSARWVLGSWELRLHRARLLAERVPPPSLGEAPAESSLSVQATGTYELPGWHGTLRVTEAPQAGVPLAWLARLELRPRAGGEQFQAGIGRPARSLKKQYQDRAVPMWHRDGPLVYSGGQLIYVPGLGLDARVLGLPGQPLVQLQWVPRRTA